MVKIMYFKPCKINKFKNNLVTMVVMDYREYKHWLTEHVDKAQQDTKEFHALMDLVEEKMIDSTDMLHKFLDSEIKE